MEKQELKKQVYELIKNDDFNELLEREINRIIDGGYLNISSFDVKEGGYILAKSTLYCALKRFSEQFRPHVDHPEIKG